jgi:alkanesulfonate monooxygenase SsuD/methylene tetrahydromethanopterin reductase-like flavin-dependent oxidoreductase (luciferase family)
MSGPRIGVSVPGGTTAALSTVAQAAEAANIDCVLIGDVRGAAENHDDTYVLATAGVIAARTRHLRIGLALGLRGSAPVVRVAEDIGVVDVLSAGRVELVMRPGSDPRWRSDLDAVLRSWSGWELGDGSTVPITPCPVQPMIPTYLVDGDRGDALHPGAGMLFETWHGEIPDAHGIREIRRRRDDLGAATVVFDIAGIPEADRVVALRAIGGVVGPCLRCPDDEVGILALDSTEYLLDRTDLHEPPLP